MQTTVIAAPIADQRRYRHRPKRPAAGHLIRTVLAVMLAALSPPAHAHEDEPAPGAAMLGGALEDLCRASEVPPVMLCASYLRGSFEGLMVGQSSMAEGEMSFCLPEQGVTLAQVRDTFLRFVGEEATRRLDVAGALLLDSLQDRFPCEDADEDPFIEYAARHSAAVPRYRTQRTTRLRLSQ